MKPEFKELIEKKKTLYLSFCDFFVVCIYIYI